MQFVGLFAVVGDLNAEIVVDARLHVAYLLANENLILHGHIATGKLSDEILNRVLRGTDVHRQGIVNLFILRSDERTGAEGLVIDDDTHLCVLQTHRTVNVLRVVDVAQEKAVALHRHATGVREHFVIVKQRVLIVDVYREIVRKVQRMLLSILLGGDGDMTIHNRACCYRSK